MDHTMRSDEFNTVPCMKFVYARWIHCNIRFSYVRTACMGRNPSFVYSHLLWCYAVSYSHRLLGNDFTTKHRGARTTINAMRREIASIYFCGWTRCRIISMKYPHIELLVEVEKTEQKGYIYSVRLCTAAAFWTNKATLKRRTVPV